tara:strand:+ start:848 stop:1240 length:393 start_codon:yes stop_codon:yes gene_type:complete
MDDIGVMSDLELMQAFLRANTDMQAEAPPELAMRVKEIIDGGALSEMERMNLEAMVSAMPSEAATGMAADQQMFDGIRAQQEADFAERSRMGPSGSMSDAEVARMRPQLRPKGSGSTSDIEAQQYRKMME